MPENCALRLFAACLLFGVGCGRDTRPPAKDVVPASTPGRKPSDTTWKVTLHGLGPLSVGMTAADIRAKIGKIELSAEADTSECAYGHSAGLPAGSLLMFQRGVLVRVDIVSGTVPTNAGVRIGSTEAEVSTAYGALLAVSPHKYTSGHYLTVVPAQKADSNFRIVFETDGTKVLRYRSGAVPSVELVEGCG